MAPSAKQQQQQQQQQEGWRLTHLMQIRPCRLLVLLQLLLLLPECMGMEAEQQLQGLSAAAGGGDNVVRHRPAPVIGVLIQPVDDNLPHEISGIAREQLQTSRVSYLAASYVKLIEAAGCVALPIDLSMSEGEHKNLFSQMNGLLLPGGSADISAWDKPYLKIAKLYYQLAQESNDKGSFFPIFAICLGFEALMIIGSGNTNYFTRMDDNNLDRRRVLTFSREAKDSILFGTADFNERMQTTSGLALQEAEKETRGAPWEGPPLSSQQEDGESGRGGAPGGPGCIQPEEDSGPVGLEALRSVFAVEEVKRLLSTHPIAYFHHHRHISLEEFRADANLTKDFLLLSTAELPSEQPIEIVAAVEHKRYPFFGMQYHPEKALYEHCPKSRIPHFFLSVLPSLYLAAFMGLAARRSRNAFKCEREKFVSVAFAFTPTRTALLGKEYHFEQTYLFADITRQQDQTQRRGVRGFPQTHTEQQSPPLIIVPAPRPQQQPQQQPVAAAAAEEA
ncbi:hypothetical protein Esti_006580 [Eimeria stiedai]